jgi:hypothetical protein
LSNSLCVPCASSIANCSSCSIDGKTCNQCLFPYILTANTCYSATINNILNGGNPTNNTVGNTTIQTVTLPNGTVVPVVLDSNGCNQVQFFYYGKCISQIPQCQIYQMTGLCQICNAGYLVNIYGSCSPNTTVLRC